MKKCYYCNEIAYVHSTKKLDPPLESIEDFIELEPEDLCLNHRGRWRNNPSVCVDCVNSEFALYEICKNLGGKI